MRATRLWRVMNPVRDHDPGTPARFVTWLVASGNRMDAARIAEQAALELGIAFEGDIELAPAGRAVLG